jgi:hypothetical protein
LHGSCRRERERWFVRSEWLQAESARQSALAEALQAEEVVLQAHRDKMERERIETKRQT